MKLSFYGAAQTVTGSKHVISLENGTNILLDCGMYQGLGKQTYELNNDFGFEPKTIDYLFLSHAHIDHSGLIPKLVKEGFEGKIFCTEATYDLCEIMLADSAFIQEADARFVNKRKKAQGKEPIEPLYTSDDVEACLKYFEKIPYNKEVKIDDFVKVTYTVNGHILGSACVNLNLLEGSTWKKLAFTGDIGRYNSAFLKDPAPFPQADFIICESTYGNRLHENIDKCEETLLKAIQHTCIEKKGKIIIPAFSLGRTQEIIYGLNKLDIKGLLPDVKIYVDSPLAISATNITKQHYNCLNDKVREFAQKYDDAFGFNDLIYVRDKKESQKLNNTEEPCVIISAAGMAEAGRVKHHIMNSISNPKNTILIAGYAEPMSLAGKLRRGEKEVRIFGELYPVLADVEAIQGLSAHGDYNEMIQFLSCQEKASIEKIFIVHGEIEAQENFKRELKNAGFNHIFIPHRKDFYYL